MTHSCTDPEHPDGSFCLNTTGLPGCYPPQSVQRAFDNPCMYCGTDEDEIPYEDTEEHRNTSDHQWTAYNS